jgi:hypothetical protein
MWKAMQELIPIVLVILLITQYVIPIIMNTKTWWLFKRETKKPIEVASPSTLLDEIKATRVVVDEAKTKAAVVQEKVEENLKTASDLKKEADKL